MLADYGQDVNFHDNLHLFSSRGPREDGAFKPSAVAPGAAVSTAPLWQAGVGLPYALPPGYQLANGTSMASPQAAGVGALLVSAAKATGIQHQPAQIRQALMSSSRYLDPDRFEAYDQGVGILDTAAAWTLLQTQAKTVDISSSVDVHTVLSGFLATPGKGQGIYDREGVTIGQNYSRTYTFRRTSGGGGSTTYNVSWRGDDGTFSSAGSIALPKNANVNFTVNVTPSAYGAHSAILRLDDPSNPGIEYQTMNTVIVPYDFTAAGNYAASISGTIDIAQAQHFFFRVPAGTPAFKVDMAGGSASVGTGQMRFLRWHPYGVGIDSNAVSNCYNPPAAAGCSTGSPTSRTTTNPQAGVWEVSLDTRRTSDADDAPFTLTASILGATVSPNPDVIASASIGVPIARSYTLTNLFGAFTGRAVGTSLGSAFRATPTIANLAQQQYPVTVTAGSTSLRATIGGTSDPAADLDLFVFNCTSGSCVLAGQSADGDSEESVTIANPAAGLWVVLVDGFAVPAGTTTYNYIDTFANPAFGSVVVTDANALRPAGSSWTVPASVTANSAPASGRVLYGNVQVRTDTNVLIGSGDVVIQSVTP
jgi:Subtilase family